MPERSSKKVAVILLNSFGDNDVGGPTQQECNLALEIEDLSPSKRMTRGSNTQLSNPS
jgi:hypothetical protein